MGFVNQIGHIRTNFTIFFVHFMIISIINLHRQKRSRTYMKRDIGTVDAFLIKRRLQFFREV